MARDRKGAQLSLELAPELLERLRARAAAEGGTAAALVRRWIAAGLDASTAPGLNVSDLSERVGCLEREVAQLQAGALRVPRPQRSQPASPDRVIPSPHTGEITEAKHLQAVAASPNRVIPAPHTGEVPAGGIETSALADRLGIKRGALNARISRAGGAASGLEVEGWRCVGMRVPDRGGPARAVWEQA